LLVSSLAVHTPIPQASRFRFQQFYPGSITAPTGTFINAIIADDPDTLFKAVIVSGTTVVTGIQYSAIGENADLVQNTGSTVTGNSAVAINATTGTAKTKPIRIVDVIPDSSYDRVETAYWRGCVCRDQRSLDGWRWRRHPAAICTTTPLGIAIRS
jgi:hypothetical protein